MGKTFLIIAGETSGDKHAARLVESLKKREDVMMIGIGGDNMKAAGVKIIHDVKEMSVMGFAEIISKLPFFRKVRRDLLKSIREENPTTVILVDYPGFNLRFAKFAKRNGLKVVYFISPQIWAWGKRRIRKIRRTVDMMLTIFKFEEEMYKVENVAAHFVGHPLLDEIGFSTDMEVRSFRESLSAQNSKGEPTPGMNLVALLPGSRLQEIKRILPGMLESIKMLREEMSAQGANVDAVVGCAPGIDETIYQDIMGRSGIKVHLSQEVELLMSAANAGIVTSGTATLEAALHNLPIVVVYRTSALTYWIGRLIIRLDSISLVNIVAQKKIVEELVQSDFKPKRAARILKEILTNTRVSEEIKRKYSELRIILGSAGASDRAAELILSDGLGWKG